MKEKMWCYLIHLADNMWHDTEGDVVSPWRPRLTCDDGVWREVTDFLPASGINTLVIDVGDALQYESHPEISIPGAWSKDKLRAELSRLRGMGLTPIPKLNFSAGHDAWLKDYARMLSTPAYYRVCEDLIREVAEVFDYPAFFHLGFDEENAVNQRSYNYVVIRQFDLWWHDAYFFFNACEKVGARPWIWGDYAWEHRDEFIEKMPRSVLISNWYYGTIRRGPDGKYDKVAPQTYVELDRAGFEQVPTSSTWTNWWNSRQTMELGRDVLTDDLVLGYMTAPWVFTTPDMKYALLNDAHIFGAAKRDIYGAK